MTRSITPREWDVSPSQVPLSKCFCHLTIFYTKPSLLSQQLKFQLILVIKVLSLSKKESHLIQIYDMWWYMMNFKNLILSFSLIFYNILWRYHGPDILWERHPQCMVNVVRNEARVLGHKNMLRSLYQRIVYFFLNITKGNNNFFSSYV